MPHHSCLRGNLPPMRSKLTRNLSDIMCPRKKNRDNEVYAEESACEVYQDICPRPSSMKYLPDTGKEPIFTTDKIAEFARISENNYQSLGYKNPGQCFNDHIYKDPRYISFFEGKSVKRGNEAKNWRDLDDSCYDEKGKLKVSAVCKRPFLCQSLGQSNKMYMAIMKRYNLQKNKN